MTLKVIRFCENHETRICLSGELRCTHLVSLRAEMECFGQPASLDLSEVNIVDIDGIRFLIDCEAQGIQVVNCSAYIRQWMIQEKRANRDEE